MVTRKMKKCREKKKRRQNENQKREEIKRKPSRRGREWNTEKVTNKKKRRER